MCPSPRQTESLTRHPPWVCKGWSRKGLNVLEFSRSALPCAWRGPTIGLAVRDLIGRLVRNSPIPCIQACARFHDTNTVAFGGMSELLKRQIERLETDIDLSTDWLEIRYLMSELDQLKALYEESSSEAA